MARLTCVVLVACALAGCGGHASTGQATRIVWRAAPGTSITTADLDQTAATVRARLKALALDGDVTVRPKTRDLVIRVRSPLDRATREHVLAQSTVAFYDLEPSLLAPSVNSAGDAVPTRNLQALLSRASAARHVIISCSARSTTVCPGDPVGVPPAGRTDYYLFKPDPVLTGRDLVRSSIKTDFDPTTGAPIVLLGFTAHGNAEFHDVTRREARRGRAAGQGASCSIRCAFAIVLDGQIRSWPAVDPDRTPNGIDPTSTGAEINAIPTLAEARRMTAGLLAATGIPVRFVVVSG